MIDLLIQKGANANQKGPLGNPLEFLWATAHSASCHLSHSVYAKGVRDLIRALIRVGAINQRKDPNGLIPSKDQMWFIGCNQTDIKESHRYYKEGPLPGRAIWSGPTSLNLNAGHEHSKFDLAFDFERMVELNEDEVEFDDWKGWIKKPTKSRGYNGVSDGDHSHQQPISSKPSLLDSPRKRPKHSAASPPKCPTLRWFLKETAITALSTSIHRTMPTYGDVSTPCTPLTS